MTAMPSPTRTSAQNAEHAKTGTAGTGRLLGFTPAYLDFSTMRVHPARFRDGTPSPDHRLDGLPDDLVLCRLPSGKVVRTKATLIPGFERGGFFYTHTAATRACEEWKAALPGSRRSLLPPLG